MKKTTKDITLMRILCATMLIGIIGVAAIAPSPATTLEAHAKETDGTADGITVDQLTTNAYDFIKIEKNLYYDPATDIVYMKEATYGFNYVYLHYIAPDGLPWKYDPSTKTFHTVTSEKEANGKKGKNL